MVQVRTVDFRVNGEPVTVNVSPFTTLAQILRDHLGLRGTKVGCNAGECGSCTVVMDGEAVSSCMVLAPQVAGRDILTIEGIADEGELHPLQEAFLREGAVQCGFCTPGLIMSTLALLRDVPDPTEQEIQEAISGNLCRCTGYQKIIRAIQSYLDEIQGAGGAT